MRRAQVQWEDDAEQAVLSSRAAGEAEAHEAAAVEASRLYGELRRAAGLAAAALESEFEGMGATLAEGGAAEYAQGTELAIGMGRSEEGTSFVSQARRALDAAHGSSAEDVRGAGAKLDPLDGDASSDASETFESRVSQGKSSGVEAPMRLLVVDDDSDAPGDGGQHGMGDTVRSSVDMSLRLSAVSLPEGVREAALGGKIAPIDRSSTVGGASSRSGAPDWRGLSAAVRALASSWQRSAAAREERWAGLLARGRREEAELWKGKIRAERQ